VAENSFKSAVSHVCKKIKAGRSIDYVVIPGPLRPVSQFLLRAVSLISFGICRQVPSTMFGC
jgi:hypothetical protein